MAHKALGRGLNALFSEVKTATKDAITSPTAPGNEVRELSLASIRPNRHQPRLTFDESALQELADSIKTHGVAQPVVVTETAPNEYELVVGERRLRASKLAGRETIPAVVRKMTNRERFEVALIENIQRQDLNAFEEALALDGLMKEFTLTQEEVAQTLGKSRSAVANTLRLLKLHENVQGALRSGQISEGHAKILAGLPEHSEQLRFLEKILADKLTVRQLESLMMQTKPKKKIVTTSAASPDAEMKRYTDAFQQILGRRVEIQSQGKKGWVRFAFYSPWDFELLCKKLGLLDPSSGEPKA